jgi:hypothetical protein
MNFAISEVVNKVRKSHPPHRVRPLLDGTVLSSEVCRSSHDHGTLRVGTLVSQEQMSKDLISPLKQLFECLVWKCVPALLYEVVDSKFQVSLFLRTCASAHTVRVQSNPHKTRRDSRLAAALKTQLTSLFTQLFVIDTHCLFRFKRQRCCCCLFVTIHHLFKCFQAFERTFAKQTNKSKQS